MSEHQKPDSPVTAKQEIIITPANKRIMIFMTTTVIMLSGAIIISSFSI